ncbi:MAG: hypothetical protein M1461_07925 [Nitrospirae bacterium]|nr:hypothetical protein [Nitrospirota bacterium]
MKDRTDEFTKKLDTIERTIQNTFSELKFRRNFSAFLTLIFAGLAVVVALLSATYKE